MKNHTQLPPIHSNVTVRIDGVIMNGVVTRHHEKDGKPAFDIEYDYQKHDGKIIKASKWVWPEQIQRESKKFTVGDGYAIMILVGQRLGLDTELVDYAKSLLKGLPTHPIVAAAIEKEAIILNDRLRHDAELINKANLCAQHIKAEYGF